MSDLNFSLLVALDILLDETGVASATRCLNLGTSVMSRTLSRLCGVIGDPILVHAGCNMVLTLWTGATRSRARCTVHEVRAVLQPLAETFCVRSLARLFAIRVSDGFVMASGPAFIVVVASAALDICIRFMPKPGKTSCHPWEELVDLEIGIQSDMGPGIRLQRLSEDRSIGIVRKEHPLTKQVEVDVGDYITWGHMVASPDDVSHGSVDDALAELGTKRKIASVVPGFPTALSVAPESDLIAMIPALYLLNQQVTGQIYAFELPFKSRRITVLQMWHSRVEHGPGYR